ncbi:MAG: M56 family metallopeptidase, partial [Candidatus Latescibacterota bacterium]
MDTVDILLRMDAAGFALVKAFLSLLWQSCLLFAAVVVLSWMLRKKRAALRHLLWTGALFALPLLPLFSHLAANIRTPRVEIAVIPAYTPPPENPVPLSLTPIDASTAPIISHQNPVKPAQPLTITDYPWAIAFIGYAVGAAALVAVLGLGLFRLYRWRTRGRAITDPQIQSICAETAYKIRLLQPAAVLECSGLSAPLTTGVFHPTVLLPEDFAGSLSEQELRAVAAHELAHIRRHDPLTLALVSFVRAVLFFHPLVWYTSREIANLAEEACDDQVIDTGHDPVSYAALLYRLSVALRRPPLMTEFGAGFVFSQNVFLKRVKAILAGKERSVRKVTTQAIAWIILASVLSLAGAIAVPLGEKAGVPKATDQSIMYQETITEESQMPVQLAQADIPKAPPDTTKIAPAQSPQ